MRERPRIGITLGDPGGIGPEILLKALRQEWTAAEFILFGSFRVVTHHSKTLGISLDLGRNKIIDVDNISQPYFGPRPEEAGPAGIEYLQRAFEFFEEGKLDGLVTGPIQKESWHRCGYQYPGQTEFCAAQTGSTDFCMLMVGDHFRIAILSTHLSLEAALRNVRKDEIVRIIRLIHREFSKLGFGNPRIACAALNPHAGENGAFGAEEQQAIQPALDQLRTEGIEVEGPIAPEVVFRVAAKEDRWDVVLAMYHDQAMIPLKLLDFERSANVTLGLPLIRTSPDHGTAFDIAGKGIANPGSMIYAMQLAIDWTLKSKAQSPKSKVD